MKGAFVYFSGTGNTEYVIKQLIKEFQEKNIDCKTVDITKESTISPEFDFYVVASPIHVEVFPKIFVDWIKNNLPKVDSKRCIVISTQASYIAYGGRQIGKILDSKGYDVVCVKSMPMPNNYYLGKFFKATTKERQEEMKKEVLLEVKNIVDKFLKDDVYIEKESVVMTIIGKITYDICIPYFHSWARKSLSIDYDKCIKCKKCEKDCPTHNILFKDKIVFKNKCISCQRCLQKCPVNAFLYKGENFNQVKIKED